ncbi:MAG: hypothetical protein Q9171_004905 [Xanthocarpia ochracea]
MWERELKSTGFRGLDTQIQNSEDPRYALSAMMATAADSVSPQFDSDIVVVPLGDDPPDSMLFDLRIFVASSLAPDTLFGYLEVPVMNTRGPFQTSYVSLDLDPQRHAWTPQCLDTVVKVFIGTFDTTVKRYRMDNEFSERDGVVRVARIVENQVENRAIQDNLEMEEQPFFQDGRELRLDAQTPGAIDSLIFRDVTGQSEEALPGNCVEIQPLAFGLNLAAGWRH